ncbi:MAG: HDOD domain-containing protein [Azonexus sp.]|nr:HDOD domain-containing protein [Betaproteobacteria bacterium]MBK8917312.1 HDOD domain-containing protein [Betaproteobacteria bacterium]MBP6035075.1 HDOD domain-containing protein [Azonexus sp.]MBP6905947.1 HDOD domain-containing protein [Azonexus sp.]
MLDHPLQDLEAWLLLFSGNSLPVLRQTKRQIQAMRADLDGVDGRKLARVILQDPIMTVRVLAYIQPITGKALHRDITTIAGAVLMAGIEPFFNRFQDMPTIEGMLADEDPQALLAVLQTIRRAQRAADYADSWAHWRHDKNPEEVRIAALLHDLAEILVGCFAPRLLLRMRSRLVALPGLRSAVAQSDVLGFTFLEIQMALCGVWHLPELLKELIDDDNAGQLRVKNVTLAVRLARHSAKGWNDPALPDDLQEIADLVHLSREALAQRLGIAQDAPPDQPQ